MDEFFCVESIFFGFEWFKVFRTQKNLQNTTLFFRRTLPPPGWSFRRFGTRQLMPWGFVRQKKKTKHSENHTIHIPGSSKCVKCVPFHPKNQPKGRNFTYLEDPRVAINYNNNDSQKIWNQLTLGWMSFPKLLSFSGYIDGSWSSNTPNSNLLNAPESPYMKPIYPTVSFHSFRHCGKTNLKPGYVRMQKMIDLHTIRFQIYIKMFHQNVRSTYLPYLRVVTITRCLGPFKKLKVSICEKAPVLDPPKFPPKFGVGHWLQTKNSCVDLWTLDFFSSSGEKHWENIKKITSAFPKVMLMCFFPRLWFSQTCFFLEICVGSLSKRLVKSTITGEVPFLPAARLMEIFHHPLGCVTRRWLEVGATKEVPTTKAAAPGRFREVKKIAI